jgi:transglutaminase-like putative cysteine protease
VTDERTSRDRCSWHYLVLLGLLCQGFACQQWLMALVFGGLWWWAIRASRPVTRVPEPVEAVLLTVCLWVAYQLAPRVGIVWFASVSNALVLYQLLRLAERAGRRKRYFSAAVAVTQIAVGAQAVFDYRFALILIGALALLPATLRELEASRHGVVIRPRAALPRWREAALLFFFMGAFFVLFPRTHVSTYRSRLGMVHGGQQREIDMGESADDEGDLMVFRIEGEDIGYLRCLALDVFDGSTWRASPKMYREVGRPHSNERDRAVHRQVKVLAHKVLRTALPVDGAVLDMRGDYTQWPILAEHGGAMMPLPLRRPSTYYYWTRPGPLVCSLSPDQRRRYTAVPEVSAGVRQWTMSTVGEGLGPREQAERLVQRFRTEFTYQLGAPVLRSDTALEEFLLVRKEGHCGRYASALSALLRTRNIPARVVLGYLPSEENAFGGFYNVRTRHAHAWSEAWFEDEGWVTLDATPVGESIPRERRRLSLTLYEWVEFVWYSKIVEFGFAEQIRLAGGITHTMQAALTTVLGTRAGLVLAVVLVGALTVVRKLRDRYPRKGAGTSRQRAAFARNFYGRFLRLLRREHHVKRASQTPLEFLSGLRGAEYPRGEDAEVVTRQFCRVRYAESPLSDVEEAEIGAALDRIRRRSE